MTLWDHGLTFLSWETSISWYLSISGNVQNYICKQRLHLRLQNGKLRQHDIKRSRQHFVLRFQFLIWKNINIDLLTVFLRTFISTSLYFPWWQQAKHEEFKEVFDQSFMNFMSRFSNECFVFRAVPSHPSYKSSFYDSVDNLCIVAVFVYKT